jgi:hypothetical protein
VIGARGFRAADPACAALILRMIDGGLFV